MNTTVNIYEKYKKQIDELTNVNPELGNFFKSEFLKKEAKRRGYKNGNYECLIGVGTDEVDDSEFFYKDGKLWQGVDGDCCNKIFGKGIWAEIKNPIKEKIEKLKQELKELEKLCK